MFDNISQENWNSLFYGKSFENVNNFKVVDVIDMRGDGECGGSGTVGIIFEYDGQFYKKSGFVDSWDDWQDFATWDGNVVEVKKVIKTIEVWE